MSSPAPLNRPEPLGAHHQVAAFDCAAPALNEFLSRHALGNHRSGTAKTYVATADSHLVVGYPMHLVLHLKDARRIVSG